MRPHDKTPTKITYAIVVDRDRLVFAHASEKVLPANLSECIRALVESAPSDKRFRYEP